VDRGNLEGVRKEGDAMLRDLMGTVGGLTTVLAIVLACGVERASAQPFPGGLPACQAQLNACTTDLGTCTTDLGSCTTDLGSCTTDLQTCQAALAAAQPFPATGQTTCWSAGFEIPCAGTGQDGEIQAGATLSYTDNGDGTITDNNTRLMWEKKSDDGTIHDQDNTYTWASAHSFFIAVLNAGGGFAGYTDWRVPNIKELQSILNYDNNLGPAPAVSAAFNTGCAAACTVLTCSCTLTATYWSSTTYQLGADAAWVVEFGGGQVTRRDKVLSTVRVRAVRGGL
jgi:hypothetical protein